MLCPLVPRNLSSGPPRPLICGSSTLQPPPCPSHLSHNLNSHLSFGLALVWLTWRDAGVLARSWPMTMTTPCLCQKHEMALLSSRSSRHFLRLLSIPMYSLYVRTVPYAWSWNAECGKRVPWLTRVSGHVNCPNEVQVCSMWKFETLDMRRSWQWHWFSQLLMSSGQAHICLVISRDGAIPPSALSTSWLACKVSQLNLVSASWVGRAFR